MVNPEVYFKCNDRILFLLKEAYSKEEYRGDLRVKSIIEYLDDETHGISVIWRRVSEWTKLIVDSLEGQYKTPLFKEGSSFLNCGNEYLRRIAVVNVKKSNGKPNSENDDLQDYVEKDVVELRKQLMICDPTIIVCGNVGQYLRQIIEDDLRFETQVEKDHFVYWFNLNGHKVKVISYWHPSNQFPDILNYYGFSNICRVAFGKR